MKKTFLAATAAATLFLSACKTESPDIIVSNMYVENTTPYTLYLGFKIKVFEQTKRDTTFNYTVLPNQRKIIFSLQSMPYFNNLEYPNYYDTLHIKVGTQNFTQIKGTGMLNMDNYIIQKELTHTEGSYTYYERYFAFDDEYLNYLISQLENQ